MLISGLRPTTTRTPEVLGSLIRHARTRAGMTQEDLAKRTGLSRHLVRSLEAGRETRAIQALFDTLAALGLEIVVRPRGSAE